MNIYVGNLNYSITEEELSGIFGEFGEVTSVKIIIDKYTHRSKGFAFVEMPNDAEGQEAINQLNGADMKGRDAKVNEARPQKER